MSRLNGFKRIRKLYLGCLPIKKGVKKKQKGIWFGNYKSWDDARNESNGYDAAIILEKCKESLLKIKRGEAVYERDSVLFDEIQYSWPLLAYLLRIGIENNGKLSVLDFGGSLGSSYFQNRKFLTPKLKVEWSIIEQQDFFKCGRKYFEEKELKFYQTVEDCLSERAPPILLLSSVLQYIEDPYNWIGHFLEFNFDYIILDRTAFIELDRDILTVQNVPKEIYKASYPAWFFNFEKLKEAFSEQYTFETSFDSSFTKPMVINDSQKVFWKGLIFKKRK